MAAPGRTRRYQRSASTPLGLSDSLSPPTSSSQLASVDPEPTFDAANGSPGRRRSRPHGRRYVRHRADLAPPAGGSPVARPVVRCCAPVVQRFAPWRAGQTPHRQAVDGVSPGRPKRHRCGGRVLGVGAIRPVPARRMRRARLDRILRRAASATSKCRSITQLSARQEGVECTDVPPFLMQRGAGPLATAPF